MLKKNFLAFSIKKTLLKATQGEHHAD